MPRASTIAPPPPQKVNVSVDVPQNQPAAPVEKEEKSPSWFWDTLQDIPKEKWGSEWDVMGWRIDPKPGVTPGGKGFLFLIAEPITPQWIKQNYGGGKFRCILQKNSRFKTSHEFDIEGQPRYDLTREIPNVPVNSSNGNADFQKEFISVLREELQRSRDNPQTTTKGTDEVVTMLTSASEKAMEIVTRQAPQVTSGVSQVRELVGALKEMGIIGAPAVTQQKSLLEQIVELVSNQTVGPLVLNLLKPSDPLAELAKLKGVKELLDGFGNGGSSGGAKDWRAMLAEGAVAKGPEILRELRETFQVSKEAAEERRIAAENIRRVEELRHSTTAPANGQPAPAAIPSGPLRTVPIDHSQPAAEPAPAAAPPAAPGMTAAETDAVGKFMEQRIVQMIADDRDAEDIVDFIEEIDSTMNDMLATYSAEMVTTFLAGRPIIGEATRHPKWSDFLSKAQAYIKEIREEDAAINAATQRVPA